MLNVMLQDASDFNFDADPTSFLSGGMKEKTASNNTNDNSQVLKPFRVLLTSTAVGEDPTSSISAIQTTFTRTVFRTIFVSGVACKPGVGNIKK